MRLGGEEEEKGLIIFSLLTHKFHSSVLQAVEVINSCNWTQFSCKSSLTVQNIYFRKEQL